MRPFQAFAILGALHCIASPAASAAIQAAYTFAPGDLEEWTQITIPGASGTDRRFFATNSNFGNRVTWGDPSGNVGGLIVTDASNADSRDGAHNTAVLRSPSFTLNGSNAEAELDLSPTNISFKLIAGMGSSTGPGNFSNLPATTANNSGNVAHLGVGLRRTTDGAYLLWGRRTSNTQGGAWQTITWDATTLANAVASDEPGTLYTLDVIDAGHGSWGWMGMDSLTMIDENKIVNVSVKPLDTTGDETGADQDLSLRFTRTGNISEALDVSFSLTGTAMEYTDFEELPGYSGSGYTITFPAGEETVDLPVHIIPNETPEVDRSLRINIQPSEDYIVTTPSVAQLWISDLPAGEGLLTASGPMGPGTYLPIQNPLTPGAEGSLFFYGEATYSSGFLVLGIRTASSDNAANGGVDIGRNTASGGTAIFDYLDNKGGSSADVRVPGSPAIPISGGGRYTVIGEIEMHADNTGNLRAWIWDGASGSYEYAAPHIVTTFSSSFTQVGEQIHVRLDGASGTSWTNARAIWVEGLDDEAREAAFNALTPPRPFIHVKATVPTAGEFGTPADVVFDIIRSGLPKGPLEVPLGFSGSASAADFSVEFPTTALFEDAQSSAQYGLPVVADTLYEGNEDIMVDIENTMDWLVPLTPYPTATVTDRPFQGWMASTLPGSTSGPEDDSDNDEWANILEYFSGTLPGDAASRAFGKLAPGQTSTLRFQRNPQATDVEAKVLWSTEMTTWRESGESDGLLTVNITEEVVETSESGIQTIDATAESIGADVEKLFLRLSVELP